MATEGDLLDIFGDNSVGGTLEQSTDSAIDLENKIAENSGNNIFSLNGNEDSEKGNNTLFNLNDDNGSSENNKTVNDSDITQNEQELVGLPAISTQVTTTSNTADLAHEKNAWDDLVGLGTSQTITNTLSATSSTNNSASSNLLGDLDFGMFEQLTPVNKGNQTSLISLDGLQSQKKSDNENILDLFDSADSTETKTTDESNIDLLGGFIQPDIVQTNIVTSHDPFANLVGTYNSAAQSSSLLVGILDDESNKADMISDVQAGQGNKNVNFNDLLNSVDVSIRKTSQMDTDVKILEFEDKCISEQDSEHNMDLVKDIVFDLLPSTSEPMTTSHDGIKSQNLLQICQTQEVDPGLTPNNSLTSSKEDILSISSNLCTPSLLPDEPGSTVLLQNTVNTVDSELALSPSVPAVTSYDPFENQNFLQVSQTQEVNTASTPNNSLTSSTEDLTSISPSLDALSSLLGEEQHAISYQKNHITVDGLENIAMDQTPETESEKNESEIKLDLEETLSISSSHFETDNSPPDAKLEKNVAKNTDSCTVFGMRNLVGIDENLLNSTISVINDSQNIVHHLPIPEKLESLSIENDQLNQFFKTPESSDCVVPDAKSSSQDSLMDINLEMAKNNDGLIEKNTPDIQIFNTSIMADANTLGLANNEENDFKNNFLLTTPGFENPSYSGDFNSGSSANVFSSDVGKNCGSINDVNYKGNDFSPDTNGKPGSRFDHSMNTANDNENSFASSLSETSSLHSKSSSESTTCDPNALQKAVNDVLQSVLIGVAKEMKEYSDDMDLIITEELGDVDLINNNITPSFENGHLAEKNGDITGESMDLGLSFTEITEPQPNSQDASNSENTSSNSGASHLETFSNKKSKTICDGMNDVIDSMASDDGVACFSSGTQLLNSDILLITNESESKQDNNADSVHMFELDTTCFASSTTVVHNSCADEINDNLLPFSQEVKTSNTESLVSLEANLDIFNVSTKDCDMSDITTAISQSSLHLSDNYESDNVTLPGGQNINRVTSLYNDDDISIIENVNVHTNREDERTDFRNLHDQICDIDEQTPPQKASEESTEEHITKEGACAAIDLLSYKDQTSETSSNDSFELVSSEEVALVKKEEDLYIKSHQKVPENEEGMHALDPYQMTPLSTAMSTETDNCDSNAINFENNSEIVDMLVNQEFTNDSPMKSDMQKTQEQYGILSSTAMFGSISDNEGVEQAIENVPSDNSTTLETSGNSKTIPLQDNSFENSVLSKDNTLKSSDGQEDRNGVVSSESNGNSVLSHENDDESESTGDNDIVSILSNDSTNDQDPLSTHIIELDVFKIEDTSTTSVEALQESLISPGSGYKLIEKQIAKNVSEADLDQEELNLSESSANEINEYRNEKSSKESRVIDIHITGNTEQLTITPMSADIDASSSSSSQDDLNQCKTEESHSDYVEECLIHENNSENLDLSQNDNLTGSVLGNMIMSDAHDKTNKVQNDSTVTERRISNGERDELGIVPVIIVTGPNPGEGNAPKFPEDDHNIVPVAPKRRNRKKADGSIANIDSEEIIPPIQSEILHEIGICNDTDDPEKMSSFSNTDNIEERNVADNNATYRHETANDNIQDSLNHTAADDATASANEQFILNSKNDSEDLNDLFDRSAHTGTDDFNTNDESNFQLEFSLQNKCDIITSSEKNGTNITSIADVIITNDAENLFQLQSDMDAVTGKSVYTVEGKMNEEAKVCELISSETSSLDSTTLTEGTDKQGVSNVVSDKPNVKHDVEVSCATIGNIHDLTVEASSTENLKNNIPIQLVKSANLTENEHSNQLEIGLKIVEQQSALEITTDNSLIMGQQMNDFVERLLDEDNIEDGNDIETNSHSENVHTEIEGRTGSNEVIVDPGEFVNGVVEESANSISEYPSENENYGDSDLTDPNKDVTELVSDFHITTLTEEIDGQNSVNLAVDMTSSQKESLMEESDGSSTTEASFSIHSDDGIDGQSGTEESVYLDTEEPIPLHSNIELIETKSNANALDLDKASNKVSDKLVTEIFSPDMLQQSILDKTKDEESNFIHSSQDNENLFAGNQNNGIGDNCSVSLIINSDTSKDDEIVGLSSFINDDTSTLKVYTGNDIDSCGQVHDQYTEIVMQPDINHTQVPDTFNVEDEMSISVEVSEKANDGPDQMNNLLSEFATSGFTEETTNVNLISADTEIPSAENGISGQKNEVPVVNCQDEESDGGSDTKSVPSSGELESTSKNINELTDIESTARVTLPDKQTENRDHLDSQPSEAQNFNYISPDNAEGSMKDTTTTDILTLKADNNLNDASLAEEFLPMDHLTFMPISADCKNVGDQDKLSMNEETSDMIVMPPQACGSVLSDTVLTVSVHHTEENLEKAPLNELSTNISPGLILAEENDQTSYLKDFSEEIQAPLVTEPSLSIGENRAVTPVDNISSPTMEFDDDFYGDAGSMPQTSMASDFIKKSSSPQTKQVSVPNTYISGHSYSSSVPSSVFIDKGLLSDDESDGASIEANATSSSDDEHNEDSGTDEDMFQGQDDFDDPIMKLLHQTSQNNSVSQSSYIQSSSDDSTLSYRGFDSGWEEIAQEDSQRYSNLSIIMEETEPSDAEEESHLDSSADEHDHENQSYDQKYPEEHNDNEDKTAAPTIIITDSEIEKIFENDDNDKLGNSLVEDVSSKSPLIFTDDESYPEHSTPMLETEKQSSLDISKESSPCDVGQGIHLNDQLSKTILTNSELINHDVEPDFENPYLSTLSDIKIGTSSSPIELIKSDQNDGNALNISVQGGNSKIENFELFPEAEQNKTNVIVSDFQPHLLVESYVNPNNMGRGAPPKKETTEYLFDNSETSEPNLHDMHGNARNNKISENLFQTEILSPENNDSTEIPPPLPTRKKKKPVNKKTGVVANDWLHETTNPMSELDTDENKMESEQTFTSTQLLDATESSPEFIIPSKISEGEGIITSEVDISGSLLDVMVTEEQDVFNVSVQGESHRIEILETSRKYEKAETTVNLESTDASHQLFSESDVQSNDAVKGILSSEENVTGSILDITNEQDVSNISLQDEYEKIETLEISEEPEKDETTANLEYTDMSQQLFIESDVQSNDVVKGVNTPEENVTGSLPDVTVTKEQDVSNISLQDENKKIEILETSEEPEKDKTTANLESTDMSQQLFVESDVQSNDVVKGVNTPEENVTGSLFDVTITKEQDVFNISLQDESKEIGILDTLQAPEKGETRPNLESTDMSQQLFVESDVQSNDVVKGINTPEENCTGSLLNATVTMEQDVLNISLQDESKEIGILDTLQALKKGETTPNLESTDMSQQSFVQSDVQSNDVVKAIITPEENNSASLLDVTVTMEQVVSSTPMVTLSTQSGMHANSSHNPFGPNEELVPLEKGDSALQSPSESNLKEENIPPLPPTRKKKMVVEDEDENAVSESLPREDDKSTTEINYAPLLPTAVKQQDDHEYGFESNDRQQTKNNNQSEFIYGSTDFESEKGIGSLPQMYLDRNDETSTIDKLASQKMESLNTTSSDNSMLSEIHESTSANVNPISPTTSEDNLCDDKLIASGVDNLVENEQFKNIFASSTDVGLNQVNDEASVKKRIAPMPPNTNQYEESENIGGNLPNGNEVFVDQSGVRDEGAELGQISMLDDPTKQNGDQIISDNLTLVNRKEDDQHLDLENETPENENMQLTTDSNATNSSLLESFIVLNETDIVDDKSAELEDDTLNSKPEKEDEVKVAPYDDFRTIDSANENASLLDAAIITHNDNIDLEVIPAQDTLEVTTAEQSDHHIPDDIDIGKSSSAMIEDDKDDNVGVHMFPNFTPPSSTEPFDDLISYQSPQLDLPSNVFDAPSLDNVDGTEKMCEIKETNLIEENHGEIAVDLIESYHEMALNIVDQLLQEVISMGLNAETIEKNKNDQISSETLSDVEQLCKEMLNDIVQSVTLNDDMASSIPESISEHKTDALNLLDADIPTMEFNSSLVDTQDETSGFAPAPEQSKEISLNIVPLKDEESETQRPQHSHRVRYETTGSVGSLTFLTDSEEEDEASIKKKKEQLISLDDDAVVDEEDDDVIEPILPDFSDENHPHGKRKSLVPPSSLILSVVLDDTVDSALNAETPVEQINMNLETPMSEELSQRSSSFVGSETSATSSSDDVTGKRSSLPKLPSLRKKEPKNESPQPMLIKTKVELVPKEHIIPISPKPAVLRMIRWETVTIKNIEYKIDETAIQPYKKVISHGGFYDDKNAIIEIFTSYLPSSNIEHYAWVMDNLFLYVLATVELLAQEKFSIVMFVGSTPKNQIPANSLLKKWHEQVDYRLKKNVEAFYIMNPTLYFRTMARIFVSRKVLKKMKYVKSMAELKSFIPTDFLFVPSEIAK